MDPQTLRQEGKTMGILHLQPDFGNGKRNLKFS
jgi:hypothetical protein